MQEIIKKIFDYSLEDIMGDRFARYSKSIILDRALPDVRDGLKPVQRRILYCMYKEGHTFDKPYVKSARSVGDIMGKYHPHGDSSIYEAMVRMSQWWKQNTTLIDMKGNNGSMEGDGAAAMRYTEARLSKVSNELLKDIHKDTVNMTWNFDDTLLEPTVLPARFPNLLVNGSNGISAGYATNIPPHNLGEIIDATIKRIENPNCHLQTILDIVKGPDFPTGGIVEGKKGIIDAFTTGRGKVVLKSKIIFEKQKNKEQIVVKEIPFDINKALLVKKIDEIRIDKKVEGISEVRNEFDASEPMRIVIDLKKDANKELILNYLLKNTDLQISYNYNIVTIINNRPMLVGILPILDAYIAHQKEVITRRTKFDLEHALARYHIVEGLIKALSILDDVIRTIRASKNKSDAKNNLVLEYGFTETQAEAIVTLQLYRLSNTDVTELETEKKNLEAIIKGLKIILSDEEKLKSIMKEELKAIKKEYATTRKTEIKDEITEIKIDTKQMIQKENVVVVVTHDGYLKRVSLRSYNEEEETLLKSGDYIIGIYEIDTLSTLLLFTDLGNYIYLPIHEIPDLKWKEMGKHVSNIVKMKTEENIIACLCVTSFDCNKYVTMFSKNGMIKRTKLSEFEVQRYSKPLTCMKLKDNDLLVSVSDDDANDVFIVTHNGLSLKYTIDEVSPVGIKASGVKAISLKDDEVVSGMVTSKDTPFIALVTDKGTGKRVKYSEFEYISRARKGVLIIRDVKTNPYKVIKAFPITHKEIIGLRNCDSVSYLKATELSILDRYSIGNMITKDKLTDFFVKKSLKKMDEICLKEEVSLDKIDEKIMTIDDFLDDFKI